MTATRRGERDATWAIRSARSDAGTPGRGWDGLAVDAVLGAAEGEKVHTAKLADGLDDLAAALANSEAALGPAVQVVNDCIADAEAAGLVVGEDSVGPPPSRRDIEQTTVDEHAQAISRAIDTVASLDRHYGREIDAIAARLHGAIPPAVDRGVIPAPNDPWPGRAADAMTGAGIGAAVGSYLGQKSMDEIHEAMSQILAGSAGAGVGANEY